MATGPKLIAMQNYLAQFNLFAAEWTSREIAGARLATTTMPTRNENYHICVHETDSTAPFF